MVFIVYRKPRVSQVVRDIAMRFRDSFVRASEAGIDRLGMPIKERLREVISILCPETLLAWDRRMKRRKWTFENTPKHPGRPLKTKTTEALALRIAEENAWGGVITWK